MQAIILAAGMGKRLKELTRNNTKCMVEVNGVTLIERMLRILDRKALDRIVIVIGYEGGKLKNYIDGLGIQTSIFYVENSVYYKTNNIYSLYLAKQYLMEDDTLLLESDIIFEESVIDLLLEDSRDTLALVDKFENWMDGTCLVLDAGDNITDFVPGKLLKYSNRDFYYKTVNIYKFSKRFSSELYLPFLEAYSRVMGNNEYYEAVIKMVLLLDKSSIKAKRLCGERWYEIDDVQDLDIAESLFMDDKEEKFKRFSARYGGYWRYPRLKDFCYLVNPYFPSAQMSEEMQSNFDVLVREYPSGLAVNSLLAAKNFGVPQEHIVVGNGAAELIKAAMELMQGRLGVIRPTFEEYPNRYQGPVAVYDCTKDDFQYDIDKITAFFEAQKVDNIIFINPDNPTGHYLSQKECLRLAEWCGERNIRLIVDESFIDFSGESSLLLVEDVLRRYDRLCVVKSISKSYGVPGLRLGILASSDEELIAHIRKSVSIWNINSFAEFYMQIYGKYEKEYAAAMRKIQQDRDIFYRQLQEARGIRVYPSAANYFLCEITDGFKSSELCAKMLEKDVLIKDLTWKMHNGKQYIRISVRDRADNELFVAKWQEMMREI